MIRISIAWPIPGDGNHGIHFVRQDLKVCRGIVCTANKHQSTEPRGHEVLTRSYTY